MPSDKTHKLQRYSRKDYSERVDFPVEIVGRDGVVRRYTFEDSIRLYQRRITFAAVRYRDTELVDAEVEHCRCRIDQLRRSYFYLFGWGTPEGEEGPESFFGDLSGELAAFMCRVLGCDGRPDVRLDPVDVTDADCSSWKLVPRGYERGMMLYVYRFSDDAEAGQERFFAALKAFERPTNAGADHEELLAFHHTADCGFVLTGRGGGAEFLAEQVGQVQPDGDTSATPWQELVELIRRGQYEGALAQCQQLVKAQPWHRRGYLAGAMLGCFLGYELTAEELAGLGALYFPDSGEMHYWAGLARFRQDHYAEALPALQRAVELEPSLTSARFLLVLTLIELRNHREARRVLRDRDGLASDDRRGEVLLVRVEQWVRWRSVMVGAGALSLGLGLVATALGGWVGLLPVFMGVLMGWVGTLAFKRQVKRIVALQRFDDVGHWLRRLNRRPEPSLHVMS